MIIQIRRVDQIRRDAADRAMLRRVDHRKGEFITIHIGAGEGNGDPLILTADETSVNSGRRVVAGRDGD